MVMNITILRFTDNSILLRNILIIYITFILLCPGEELNFLTTIFSRTLYHLSYRDLYFTTYRSRFLRPK